MKRGHSIEDLLTELRDPVKLKEHKRALTAWKGRQAQIAHNKRLGEARETLNRIAASGYVDQRAREQDRIEEARAMLDNLVKLESEVSAIRLPTSLDVAAGLALGGAVDHLDAVLNAAGWIWARGFLYQAAALIGQATAYAAQSRQARDYGAQGGANGTRDKVAKRWRELDATGRPERERSKIIAERLGITVSAVNQHVADAGLRKQQKQNRG